MNLSVADTIFLCVALIDIGGALVLTAFALHTANTKIDVMLSHLKNCPAVMVRAPFRHGGPWGRLFLLGGIMGVIVTPRVYLRDGGASAEDINNFPNDLRRRLVLLQYSGWGFLLVMLVLGIIAKFDLV